MSYLRLTFIACILALGATASTDPGERLAIVAHPDRVADLSIEEIAQIFLKQRRFWSSGEPIVPVNREAGSPTRAAFTRRILSSRARRLNVYWNRQYFHGILPPATLASDEAVKRFVAVEPNAIGYISASKVDESLQVLLFLDPPVPTQPDH